MGQGPGSGWIDSNRASADRIADAAIPWGSLLALVAAILLESFWPVIAWGIVLSALLDVSKSAAPRR